MMTDKELSELMNKLRDQKQANIKLLPEAHFHLNMGINQAIGIINAMQRKESLKAQIIENDRKLRERDERKE